MGFCRLLYVVMGPYGFLLILIRLYVFLWDLISFYGSLCVRTDPYATLWGLLSSYKFLCVFMCRYGFF